MKAWIIARLTFLGATLVALLLYVATVPDGLPWNMSAHLAAAYAHALSASQPVAHLPHSVWGHVVQTFAGHHIVLSCLSAACAAGFASVIALRFFGWRVAVGAALAWAFSPWVWNGAVTGERTICLASAAMFVAWVTVCVAHRVFRRARSAFRAERKSGGGAQGVLGGVAPASHDTAAKWARLNRWAGRTALAASVLFAVVSLSMHDYRLGEAASVYARGIVEDANGRIIVMNGLADDQVMREIEKVGVCGTLSCLSLVDHSQSYRIGVEKAVSVAFPGETNLWLAAHVGVEALAKALEKAHPDRIYVMDGRSTTREGWERRWAALGPYLKSADPFVPFARRAFGVEGNAVANALPPASAWAIYKRVCEEIDHGNLSALVNMSELIRRGHVVAADEKARLQGALDRFFKDVTKRQSVREIARAAGPIRTDPALLAKLEEESKRRIAERVAAGEEPTVAPEVLSLLEWSNAMVAALDRGELDKAGRLARMILTNEKWRNYLPANAVMGAVSAAEGDYAASEAFFSVATNTTGKIPAATLNDFADTLLHLGRPDEAEAMSRRAIASANGRFWVAGLTLAEALAAQKQNTKEFLDLCRDAVRNAPTNWRERVRARVEQIRKEAAE